MTAAGAYTKKKGRPIKSRPVNKTTIKKHSYYGITHEKSSDTVGIEPIKKHPLQSVS